jgi:hypothetical protein
MVRTSTGGNSQKQKLGELLKKGIAFNILQGLFSQVS